MRTHAPILCATAVIVINLVPDTGGVRGYVGEVGVVIIAWTEAMEAHCTSVYLCQWGDMKDRTQVCAEIQSRVAAVGDGHNCHGWTLLSENLVVILSDKGKETGTVQNPDILVAWSFFVLFNLTNRM